MKKLKIYLDTSVISHLDVTDRLDWLADTRKLWEILAAGRYEVYISKLTLDEIGRCSKDKFSIIMDYMSEVEYNIIQRNDEIDEIAQMLVDMGILRQKSLDDCVHIASAVVGGCDVIVSWNFKHMVNIRTVKGVRAISSLQGYPSIDILPPSMLLESEELT